MANANNNTLDTSSNRTSSSNFSFGSPESPPTPKGHHGPQQTSTPQVRFFASREHEPSCRPKPKNVFKSFRLLAPMDVDAVEKDDGGTEAIFWDQVVNLRNVMLENQEGDDFNFSRKMVTKFNQIAREKYPSLPEKLQCHTLVAYLDEECWTVVEQIVEKMRKGQIHGKRCPTSFTFRFLQGCRTAQQKKEILRGYLLKNSTGAYKTAKKKAYQPKATGFKQTEQGPNKKLLIEELKNAKLEIDNLTQINNQQKKEILENQIEINRLNSSITRYEQRVSYLELKIGVGEQKIKQVEHDRNVRLRTMAANNEKWRELYQQQAYIECDNIQEMHSSSVNNHSNDKNSTKEQEPQLLLVDATVGAGRREDIGLQRETSNNSAFSEDDTLSYLEGLVAKRKRTDSNQQVNGHTTSQKTSNATGTLKQVEEPRARKDVVPREVDVLDEAKGSIEESGEENEAATEEAIAGEFAAVAYSGGKFYVGKIIERSKETGCEDGEDDISSDSDDDEEKMFMENPWMNIGLKFFSWNKQLQTLFWPFYDDTDMVFGKFVYRNDVKIFPSSKKEGHFYCVPSYLELKQEYNQYREKYELK